MKIKLAVLVYEDNSVLYLPNEEAQEWIDKANYAVVIGAVHGCNPFENAPVKEDRITLAELKENISDFCLYNTPF